MITVGIEGKPGSGKSTIARMLAEHDGVEHIEVDKVVKEIGVLKFRDMILGYLTVLGKKSSTGKGKYTRKVENSKDDIHNKISTPIIVKAAKNVYFAIVSRAINKRLKKLEKNGTKIAVVDYAILNCSEIWKEFDVRVCVSRNNDNRIKAVELRDNVDSNRVDFYTSFAILDIVKYGEGDVIKIYNDGDVSALKEKSKKLLKEIIEKSKLEKINNEREEF